MNSAWHLIRRNPLATAGLVLIAVFFLLALLAPLIASQDPAHIDLPSRLQNASHAHWLGTDEL
jgi:peptide/nickel transport system permease protein